MKQIPIYYKKKVEAYAQVSDKDFKHLNQWSWSLLKSKKTSIQYAYKNIRQGKVHTHIYMHRIVLERKLNRLITSNELTDHKDCDGLNNKRSNIRLATYTQNQRNQRISKNNTSGYVGVVWEKRRKKWQAQIVIDYKCYFLGYFNNKIDAVNARIIAAKREYKQFYCAIN